MQITGVKLHHLEWERGPYHWRDEIMPSGMMARTGLLSIETDAGLTGRSPYSGGANIDEIKYQLLGQNPLDRERIWQRHLAQPAHLESGPGDRPHRRGAA